MTYEEADKKAHAAAERAFPESEWTNPGILVILRNAFYQGYMHLWREHRQHEVDQITGGY